MSTVKFFLFFLILLMNGPMLVAAQNKVVVIPMGDGDIMPLVVNSGPPVYLDEAIDKPIVWNKGWDTSIGHRTKLDPTVQISFIRLEPVFGSPGIIFTGREIRHWGEQTLLRSSKKIYAKAVLMVDKGDTVEGGAFEWSLNNQGFMSFHNILSNGSDGWIRAWTDPRPGEKVWFFIISDDEQYSSNPISFIWP